MEFEFNYDPEIDNSEDLELDEFLEYTSTNESDILGIYESMCKFQE